MGLPAYQQRVLDRMESALRASEPHLAAMFAIFTRLSIGEPVGRESLVIRRRWWLRPGTSLAALVLVPVMFALVITGVLLGGPSRAGTCAVGTPAAVTVAHGGHASCGTPVRPGQRPASTAGNSSCPATATTAHFAVRARDAQASSPSGAGASGLC